MEPLQNPPTEQQVPAPLPVPTPVLVSTPTPKEHTFKVVVLLASIALILIVGFGVVLPQFFSIINVFTQVPQDQVRQALSSNYVAPGLVTVAATSSAIDWSPLPKVKFSIIINPIFQQYGYDEPFMFQEKGFDTIQATPNPSSTLFTADTAGITTSSLKGYAVSSIMVFNKDLSFFKLMPLPKLTGGCCDAGVAWLGNRYILVNEFIAGVYPPGAGNYFYVGDTASSTANRTFEPIPMPADLSNKQYMDVSMFSHPDKNLAVISYCLTTVQTFDSSYCSQSGFSIATPARIVEVMTKNTTDSFRTGWDEDNLYIQESNQQTGTSTIYMFPIDQYENDQYVSLLDQHVDPTAHGDTVWLKTLVPITQEVDAISFDVNFTSTSTYAEYSRGFLTVSLNGTPIGEAYEEQEPPGLHQKVFYFTPPPLGTSTLEIRLDPLNPHVKSFADIEHVGFGYATSTDGIPLNFSASPSSSSSVSSDFYITPTSASISDKIVAYNSRFNNEYSELCFDNINQSPKPCSGISVVTDFDVNNPLMTFIIPPTVHAGQHTVQVCGIEGIGNSTTGCTKKVQLDVTQN